MGWFPRTELHTVLPGRNDERLSLICSSESINVPLMVFNGEMRRFSQWLGAVFSRFLEAISPTRDIRHDGNHQLRCKTRRSLRLTLTTFKIIAYVDIIIPGKSIMGLMD